MGIWNINATGGTLAGTGLITPHGDLERGRDEFIRSCKSSHNPSWGFGTIARIVIQKALEMGFDGVGISQGGSKFVHVDMKPRNNGKAVWTYS